MQLGFKNKIALVCYWGIQRGSLKNNSRWEAGGIWQIAVIPIIRSNLTVEVASQHVTVTTLFWLFKLFLEFLRNLNLAKAIWTTWCITKTKIVGRAFFGRKQEAKLAKKHMFFFLVVFLASSSVLLPIFYVFYFNLSEAVISWTCTCMVSNVGESQKQLRWSFWSY